MMFFSKRKKLSDAAVEWCHKQNAHANTFNIVTALDSLGAFKDNFEIPEVPNKKRIKNPCIGCGGEWDQVILDECPNCGNAIPF